jgi:3-methyladenine DNA glycosylase AlkC
VTTRRKGSVQIKENPKALKHLIGSDLIKRISNSIAQVFPEFDTEEFKKIEHRLSNMDLKSRVRLVCEQLYLQLPKEFSEANKVLKEAVHVGLLKGFDLWPFTEYVQAYGLKNFDESMETLSILTQKFTSEFAVRPFLIQHPEKTYALLLNWAENSNEHIRRWASEGTRPRLPWGLKLQQAVKDPSRGIQILDKLKFDDSLYVRKSVANHLNDISKDHPHMAIQLAQKWQKQSSEKNRKKIDWIILRGLRTLIKKGSPEALSLIGVNQEARYKMMAFKLNKSIIKIGSHLEFTFKIKSTANLKQKFVIDYAIHFLKANGLHFKKVFKLKTIELSAQEECEIVKKHSIKPITTRKFYSGPQFLEIQVNGNRGSKKKWQIRK